LTGQTGWPHRQLSGDFRVNDPLPTAAGNVTERKEQSARIPEGKPISEDIDHRVPFLP
jgi:hypothetical protein